MLKMFLNYLSEMAVAWAASKIGNWLFGGTGSGSGMSISFGGSGSGGGIGGAGSVISGASTVSGWFGGPTISSHDQVN